QVSEAQSNSTKHLLPQVLGSGASSIKGQRLQSLRTPDPNVAVALCGFELGAEGRAHVAGGIHPSTAAQDSVLPCCRPQRITCRTALIVVCIIPIGHPLSDVPCHVIGSVGTLVTCIVSDRGGIAIAIISSLILPAPLTICITEIQLCA